MKNKFLLSAFSLGLIFSVTHSHANNLHEDFEVIQSPTLSPAYVNHPMRLKEEELRQNYETVKTNAKVVSKEAGENAKVWWSCGSSWVKDQSYNLIVNSSDLKVKAAGVVGWGFGYIGNMFGEFVQRSVENRTNDSMIRLGTKLADKLSPLNYADDYQLTSTVGGLTDIELQQNISLIQAAAAA